MSGKEVGSIQASSSNGSFIVYTMVAGGIAGTIAKTAVAPLDRVKIHFQVRTPQYSPFVGSRWPCRFSSLIFTLVGQLSGVFRAISNTFKEQGVIGLYRGHLATVLRVFPYAAINFMAYEQFKLLFGIQSGNKNHAPVWKRIMVGSLAGCTAVTCTYPLDILRARIAFMVTSNGLLGHGLYRQAIRQLWREGGITGFYQGYFPTMLGIIPYAGTSFFTFESLKSWYCRAYGTEEIPPGIRLTFGMCAGVCAQTITYPLDLIRRRSQLWRAASHLPPSDSWRPADVVRIARDLVRVGGMRELFVGLSINYFKVAPSMGISFFIYDYLKQSMHI